MKQEARKDFLISTLYFFTVSAIVFIVCRFLLKYLTPFVIGGAIAWLVQKPAKFISGKTRIKRKLAAAGLALAVFLCYNMAVLVVSPEIRPRGEYRFHAYT